MPSVLILAPCHAVLHEDEGKQPSIISIIEGIKLQLVLGAPPPPEGTIISMAWCVYICWKQDLADAKEKQFEQRVLWKSPTGKVMMETAPKEFSFETRMVNVIVRFSNISIGHTGICPLAVEYRELGTVEWIESASYPFLMEHEVPSPKPETSKTVVWKQSK